MKTFFHPLPPANRRTVCPPGVLKPGQGGKLILVASLKRSGTHLLIDSILNNFRQYKRAPLYVDLDHILDDETLVERLIACGDYVVKTHFPQVGDSPEHARLLHKLISCCRIITPVRDAEQVYRSSLVFGTVRTREEFDQQVRRFQAFWEPYEVLRVPFRDLTGQDEKGELVSRIGQWIDAAPNAELILPFKKGERFKVYATKVITRLVGNRAPVVNTTIGFARKR